VGGPLPTLKAASGLSTVPALHHKSFHLRHRMNVPSLAAPSAEATGATHGGTGAHLTQLSIPAARVNPPRRSPWLLPAAMLGISIAALVLAETVPYWSRLVYLVPFTFLGNSLAPLPYDGALVYLGGRYPSWAVVLVAVLGTLVIEAWNMELLARILAREGTRGFRNHRVTQWSLRWYQRAPFWSLVATCVLPLVPHYPMRFLAVLAGYPIWKYQLSVILGRGARYVGLVSVGVAFPIPTVWLVLVSLVVLALGARGAVRMNRTSPEVVRADAALPKEA
jgi:membrane protein YqaA with SNARE-associated domain